MADQHRSAVEVVVIDMKSTSDASGYMAQEPDPHAEGEGLLREAFEEVGHAIASLEARYHYGKLDREANGVRHALAEVGKIRARLLSRLSSPAPEREGRASAAENMLDAMGYVWDPGDAPNEGEWRPYRPAPDAAPPALVDGEKREALDDLKELVAQTNKTLWPDFATGRFKVGTERALLAALLAPPAASKAEGNP